MEIPQDIWVYSERDFKKVKDLIEKVELKKFPENKFFVHLNSRESKVLELYI